ANRRAAKAHAAKRPRHDGRHRWEHKIQFFIAHGHAPVKAEALAVSKFETARHSSDASRWLLVPVTQPVTAASLGSAPLPDSLKRLDCLFQSTPRHFNFSIGCLRDKLTLCKSNAPW